MIIERHSIDIELANEIFADSIRVLPNVLAYAKKQAKALDSVARRALEIICCGAVVEPNSPHIQAALKLGAQAHAALFATAANPSGPVTVPLGDGEHVTYNSPPDESTVYPQRWITGFYMNMLCQDAAGLDLLESIDSAVMRKSTTKSPEYSYLYMETLKLFRHGKPEMVNTLIAALQGTDPKRVQNPDPEWALYLIGHQLEVLMYVATHDAKFSEAMGKAVEHHKQYWSKNKDRKRSYDGFISLSLTALRDMGLKRNLTLEVDSPYLFTQLSD